VARRLGLAFLSFARHQSFYAPFFAANPRVRLVAVGDEADAPERTREQNRAHAAQYGIPYVEDVKALLARDDVDLVSVCSEHVRHARLAVWALEAGKHLFLDKPVAMNAEDARAVERAAARSDRVVVLSYALRHEAAVRALRARVADGELGEVVALHVDDVGGVPDPAPPASDDYRWSRFERRDPEGGEFFNLGIHMTDLIPYVVGSRARSIYALGPSAMPAYHERGVESLAIGSMALASGATATFVAGRGAGFRGYVHHLRVVGTRGTAVVDYNRPELHVDRGGVRSAAALGRGGYARLIDLTVDAALDGGPSPAPLDDALHALQAVLAAERSLRSGRVEPIDA